MARKEPPETQVAKKAAGPDRKTLERYLIALACLAALSYAAIQFTWIRGVFGL